MSAVPHPNSANRENVGEIGPPSGVEVRELIEIRSPQSYEPDTRLLDQEVENQKANRELRDRYSEKAYKLAVGGLCFWGIVLSATGIVFALTGIQMLSDKVLIAITTGVTVNVIAAFVGVIRGLFPSHAKRPNNPSHAPNNYRVAASKLLTKRPRLPRRQR